MTNTDTSIKTHLGTLENSMKILFFAGSNSRNSINQQLVTALLQSVNGDHNTLLDLREYAMPLYSDAEEEKGIPVQAEMLLQQIEQHVLLVISVPEHNNAMPAYFKNILDWMSRARNDYRILKNKRVILLCASPGKGGQQTIINTKTILEALGATVTGHGLLQDFQNHTFYSNNTLQIKNTDFLSHFNSILSISLKQ